MANRKTLGPIQEKMINYLAENPGKNRNEIRKKLGMPVNDYRTIFYATQALEKKEYLIKGEDNLIFLTEKGVLYALSKLPASKVIRILAQYTPIYPKFQRYAILSDKIGEKLFLKLRKYLFTSVQLFDQDQDKNEIIHLGVTLASVFSKEFSEEDRDLIVKSILGAYPEFRKPFEEYIGKFLDYTKNLGDPS